MPGGSAGGRPRRHRGAIIVGRAISAIMSLAVLAGFAFYWGFTNHATQDVATSPAIANAGTAGVVFSGGVNILLVGSDARTDENGNPLTASELAAIGTTDDGGSVNTDTLMIVHIPQGGGKATAVSIPRDTWIPQSVTNEVKGPYNDGTSGTYKAGKINSFFGSAKFYTAEYLASKGQAESPAREVQSDEAGRSMLIGIVQAFTGLKIDHYAEVNLIGFYTLSNAIGGVQVCLNNAVQDSYSGANFKAGPQTVQGTTAMEFVRQRHGLPNGDLDRVRRQQAFLAGATSKMLSAGVLTSPTKLSQLSAAADKSLTLDKGFNLLTFASDMSGLSGGNVTFTTMPTIGATKGVGQDALATDPTQIKDFFAGINGGTTSTPASVSSAATSSAATSATDSAAPSAVTSIDPSSVIVDVENATTTAKMAASVSAVATAAGFTTGKIASYPGISSGHQHATTSIEYPEGGEAAAAAVQKALGGVGTLTSDSSVKSGHISVIVGKDMPKPGSTATKTTTASSSTAAPSVVAAAVAAAKANTITAGGLDCVN